MRPAGLNSRGLSDSNRLSLRGAFFKLRLKAHRSAVVNEFLGFPSVTSRICAGSRLPALNSSRGLRPYKSWRARQDSNLQPSA